MDVDDGERSSIVDNTYNGDNWVCFIKNHNRISLYIFCAINASSGEYRLV